MRFISKFQFAAAVAFIVQVAVAATATEPARHGKAIKTFRRFAEERIHHDAAPGLSIGFMYGGFTWADGFGVADLENDVAAKDVSSYRLASVTKPMTAIGIMSLANAGMLNLDAEVQEYVPYFPRKRWPVRVRDVLGHLGGISHYQNLDVELHFKEHKDTRQSLAVFEDFDLVAEPGTQFHYSSYGYNLLGAVIEGASGESYGEFMERVLWEPLGMEDTRMDDPNVVIPNRVRGYRPGPDGAVVPSEFVDMSSRFAAGGTRSTIVDLLRLAAGLRDELVLSPELVNLMWTPTVQSDGRETGYGMGWQVRSLNGRFVVRHTGGQAETRTFFMYVPSEQLAIAAAVNYEGGGWSPYVRALYQLLMGEGYNQPAYALEDRTQQLHAVMTAVFDRGGRHFDRHRRAFTEDSGEIDAAFAYVRAALEAAAAGTNPDSIAQRIHDGLDPVAGSPLPIVGSYMISVVASENDASALDRIHTEGAIELFAAYVDACRSEPDQPEIRRFPPELANVIVGLREDWRRTWTSDSRQITWPTYGDLDALMPLLGKLGRRFAGAQVYPDYSDDLSQVVTQRVVQEDAAAAVYVADWAREHYPRQVRTGVDAAVAQLAAGNVEQARTFVSEVHALEPEGAGSARGLNRQAYALRSAGALEVGLQLLDLARELHPNDANLHDSAGEFHAVADRPDEAIRCYEKALEVDPDFENARQALEKLRAATSHANR